MIECAIHKLVKDYGALRLFTDVSFAIRTKERIGLIGPNGVGKTTLLRIIMGLEDYHGGNIVYRKGVRISYLDQIPEYPLDYSTIDVLYLAFQHVFEMRAKLQQLEQKMQVLTGEKLEATLSEYGRLEQQYEHEGGYAVSEQIGRILTGLKIDAAMQERPFHLLSGGEKSRVLIGKILLETPDVLLLDEPSNHLDIQSMTWLEDYLKEYPGAVLIISHDRLFLDRVATKIVELSSKGTQIYKGNYSYYLKERQRRYEEMLAKYRAQQREIKKLEQQVERFKVWGRAGGGEKMFKRAKSVQKRLEKIEALDKPRDANNKIKLRYAGNRSGREVITLRNVSKAYDRPLFSALDLTVYYQDCLGIIGANGTGKSTLLKLILGEITPDTGEVCLGAQVKVGYLPQEVVFTNEEDNLIEAFQRVASITVTQARHELAKVLFTEDDVFKTISQLSGGERSRLKLCMLMYEAINLLILDEPTNHLDIDSREILEQSLKQFSGTIVFVSHDRYFIRKLANRLIEMENQKTKIYNGDYAYYLEQKEKQAAMLKPSEGKKVASKQKQVYLERKMRESKRRSLQNELQQVEEEIQSLEKEIKNIEERMLMLQQDAEKLHQLYLDKTELEKKLANLMQDWETVSIKLEQV